VLIMGVNKLPEVLHCEFCNTLFEPKRRNHIYCSIKCRNRTWIPQEFICSFCQKKIVQYKVNQKFCSSSCRSLYYVKTNVTLHIPRSIFEGDREEVVDKLLKYLEDGQIIKLDNKPD